MRAALWDFGDRRCDSCIHWRAGDEMHQGELEAMDVQSPPVTDNFGVCSMMGETTAPARASLGATVYTRGDFGCRLYVDRGQYGDEKYLWLMQSLLDAAIGWDAEAVRIEEVDGEMVPVCEGPTLAPQKVTNFIEGHWKPAMEALKVKR